MASAPERLYSEDVAILVALWNDLYQPRTGGSDKPRSEGLTREQLAELLVSNSPDEKPFRTKSALYKHLGGLKQVTNLVSTYTVAAKTRKGGLSKKAGHRRDLYTLAEGDCISWPATARIVMGVWDSPGHHIDEATLITSMESLRPRRDADGPVLTRDEILADIEFSIAKGYLDRYINSLRSARRLRYELQYINKIAAVCPVKVTTP